MLRSPERRAHAPRDEGWIGAKLARAGALKRVPVLGVDQGFGASAIRIQRRIDLGVLARLGMSVVEHHDAVALVTIGINAFESLGRT